MATKQTWSACKAAMRDWPAEKMLAVIHDLYQFSPENKLFLHGQLLPPSKQTVADATKALRKLISVSSIYNGGFRHNEAKKVVDQFVKSTDDPTLLADLLLNDLEMSFEAFSKVGDYPPMVDHLYATLYRLDDVALKNVPPDLIGSRVQKLRDLADIWGREFGYGISDELVAVAEAWKERWENTGGSGAA